MKWIYALLRLEHVHCFCDKKMDYRDADGNRNIIMACNKCGLERDIRIN